MEESSTQSTSSLNNGSLGENTTRPTKIKPGCEAPMLPPLPVPPQPLLPFQTRDSNCENITRQEIAEPSQNLNIQHSDLDTAIHGNIFRLNKRSIPCIYKIPDELSAQKERAYKPRAVSIGPIHSNNKRLNANEPIKLSYRDSLCSRVRGDKYMSKTMEICRSAMKELEANVVKCYAEKVELIKNNDKQISLAEMMLIDGCFILELLYRSYVINEKSLNICIDDLVFNNLMKQTAIRHDLLLLENQIPFFVLETLFSLTVECILPDNVSLTQYVLSFFGNSFSFGNYALKKKVDTSDYHILHLLHKCYLPCHDPGEGEEDETEFPKSGKKKFRFPSASDLDLAGVKFVATTCEDMFNVQFIKHRGLLRWFHSAHFEIPTLSIYDDAEPLLRNFIAFEQCCPAVPRHMTSYAFFMDTLINSAEDVKLLEKAEIFHNYLGTSEEASDLFNNICKEVVVGRFYFQKTCEAAGKHCRQLWPRFLASLRRDYFANPWTVIAVIAAFFIFGLTIVQTIYSVLAYYK